MTDLIEKEKAVRAFQGGVTGRLGRHFRAWPVVLAACAVLYSSYVGWGFRSVAAQSGEISHLPVCAPVVILRDSRGIPYITASDRNDAFFAEGFAQGSDRLFQMDLIRRYIYGELAAVLGPIQLRNDERMRALDVHDIVDREWKHLSAPDRAALRAFSAGVNAAMRTQPLPLEFRLLLYQPSPWTPRDSLAVTLAIAVSVGDTPENVVQRDALWRSGSRRHYARLLPLSDARYDVAANGTRALSRSPPLAWAPPRDLRLSGIGSNAWAAGSARTAGGRALLANDPHLYVSIPGIWYIVEMRAPGLHVAGATIPGIPGVVLGHNGRIAWAVTNAMAATISVFRAGKLDGSHWRRERFAVRFVPDVTRRYYRTRRDFAIRVAGAGTVLVRWRPYADWRSALTTILALDRARSVAGALHVLAQYAGPAQNFIIAGTSGRVAYHLAGDIADDPAWGRYVHPASQIGKTFPQIPFDQLPSIAPSRNATPVSANNKMYSRGYPYRLSPMFAPPYRAFRIAELLHAQRTYDIGYFARMQLDTFSPVDAAFAHHLAAYARAHPGLLPAAVIRSLAGWNGAFAPDSLAATLEARLRSAAGRAALTPYAVFGALRGRAPAQQFLQAIRTASLTAAPPQPWEKAGAVAVLHPFGPIGFPFLNGAPLPGDGGRFTVRMQTPQLAQSFRAVWRVGDWNRGGISIPSGESGEIGSPHYDDARGPWVAGALEPLPFSNAAVARAARSQLVLR